MKIAADGIQTHVGEGSSLRRIASTDKHYDRNVREMREIYNAASSEPQNVKTVGL